MTKPQCYAGPGSLRASRAPAVITNMADVDTPKAGRKGGNTAALQGRGHVNDIHVARSGGVHRGSTVPAAMAENVKFKRSIGKHAGGDDPVGLY